MGTDSLEPSATEWIRRLRAREISARELVTHYLRRIEEVDPSLNAVVTLDADRALGAAAEADAALLDGGDGPLLGLPVTIKDSLEVAGLRATGGSMARRNHVPRHDATAVARLRAAGAIVLAKTNVPEYSCAYETDNAVHGRTNNPHDLRRTPGGSSGGEAALAAAEATPLGLATDGLGSIRVPAHYCGVLGLRPSTGRVPVTGNWPSTRASGYMDFYCVGPIVRYPQDAALALRVIAGPDGRDPYALPMPLADHLLGDVAGLRVGVFAGSPRLTPTAGTASVVRRAAGTLREAGAVVEEIEVPWEPNPTELGFAAILADGGARMRDDVAAAEGRHHPMFEEFLETAAELDRTADEWFRLQEGIFDLRRRVRALFDDRDVLVGPVAAGPAPRHGESPGRGVPGNGDDGLHAFDPVHLLAVAGVPAAAVPVGEESGLPVGVQVAAPSSREDLVLTVAQAVGRLPGAA